MQIAEIFRSIQGEGRLTGTESVFVRTSGCNLRCWYCDTPHASQRPNGRDMSVDEVVRQVTGFGVPYAVLTGGEPLLLAESIPLCERLRAGGLHVTVETAGTLYLPVQCDLMSISPKTSNSTPRGAGHDPWRSRHEETRHAPDVVRKLIRQHHYQVKFVVDTPDDLEEIDRYLAAMPEIRTSCVMLMPQGTERQALEAIRVWLEPYCRERGFSFCPRRQIEWFGSTRGT